MNLKSEIQLVGKQAKAASHNMVRLTTKQKNTILAAMADAVATDREAIKTANAKDLEQGVAAGLTPALLDRLMLDNDRINNMVQGIRDVIDLPDPVGEIIWERTRPNGLLITKRRVPLGVIAIIYESRPNVTADAAVLCLKTSNAVILRGGKEAFHSNNAIVKALQKGGIAAGMPAGALQFIETTDRSAVTFLVQMDDTVDVVIPRGGESLIRAVVAQASVPVLKHYKGVCHLFIDESADPAKAVEITENAKCQRPGVCNAIETLLVHRNIAPAVMPLLATMAERCNVDLIGCEESCQWINNCQLATEDDWYAEYLDLRLAVKIVNSTDEAIEHINQYGSHHSDAIVTNNDVNAVLFHNEVDSAAVFVNASTRFTDGGEFGMGAEMGISTDKLHARGPMGLEELTTYKYQVSGSGQIR